MKKTGERHAITEKYDVLFNAIVCNVLYWYANVNIITVILVVLWLVYWILAFLSLYSSTG